MDFVNKGKTKLKELKKKNKIIKKTGRKFNEINISILSILGDGWNFMPPILVPSSVKLIATQILVIAKLNGNFQQKITCSKLEIDKKRCENSLILRIKALEQRRYGVFIFNCEHISFFVLIADF